MSFCIPPFIENVHALITWPPKVSNFFVQAENLVVFAISLLNVFYMDNSSKQLAYYLL